MFPSPQAAAAATAATAAAVSAAEFRRRLQSHSYLKSERMSMK
jgi:hypothetical protein